MTKKTLVLEIFSGTGSAGKVANKLGYDVISIDIDPKFKPNIVANILELKYKELPTPNFIWASVPCNTFSYLICSGKTPSRDCKTYKAITKIGELGDKILNRTLKIIRYFENLNNDLKWVIENPRGMMRRQPQMVNFDLSTTSYCNYEDARNKPTDFFNNFNLQLKPVCNPSEPHKVKAGQKVSHIEITNLDLCDRYRIPPKLIKVIFEQAFNMSGEGIFDEFLRIKKNINAKFLEGRPKVLNDLLIKEGNQNITKISICRKPVQSIIQKALNVLTFGMFKKNIEKLGYDTVYHLYMTVFLENGKIYSLEKNQRVNVVSDYISGGECEIITIKKNLNNFILDAEKLKIAGFYRYDAFKDNCQKWIKDILNANEITSLDKFILQDVGDLVPSLIQKFSKGLTDIAGVADYVIKGGELK